MQKQALHSCPGDSNQTSIIRKSESKRCNVCQDLIKKDKNVFNAIRNDPVLQKRSTGSLIFHNPVYQIVIKLKKMALP